MPNLPLPYDPDNFAILRHIGPSAKEIAEMLNTLGYASEDELIDSVLPRILDRGVDLDLGKPMTEREALEKLRETASKNRIFNSLIGMGLPRHDDTGGNRSQYYRKPGLVYRIYSVSSRNQPRPFGGFAEFSNNDRRYDRARGCQRRLCWMKRPHVPKRWPWPAGSPKANPRLSSWTEIVIPKIFWSPLHAPRRSESS